jgi:hypothetical protein
MVQTGNALIRSHRRSANSLASMMFQLRAQAVPLSPAARHVQAQAEASDETAASKATATTNEASIPLILIPPQPTRQCRISGCGALTAVTSHREANGIRVRQIGNNHAARLGVPPKKGRRRAAYLRTRLVTKLRDARERIRETQG